MPSYTALLLDPLSPEASPSSPGSCSRGALDERAAAVAETAEGNPLFIEELRRRSPSGRRARPARLPTQRAGDRRGQARRAAAGRAARARRRIRGRPCLLARRADRDGTRDDLSSLLGSLEARDLIRREAVSRISGDQQFGFKHGLIHEVAYGTLPRAARREKHAAVARFLAEATAVGQSHEALAHHWREAGENERALERARGGCRPGRPRLGQGARDQALRRGDRARAGRRRARRKSLRMRQMVAVQALRTCIWWTCRDVGGVDETALVAGPRWTSRCVVLGRARVQAHERSLRPSLGTTIAPLRRATSRQTP